MIEEKKKEIEGKGLVDGEIKYFVFKANVPLTDSNEMLSWTKSCQDKTPRGHGDYRWGKILYDHMFVQNFRKELIVLKETQDVMLELLGKIIKTLNTKEFKGVNDDLFKG